MVPSHVVACALSASGRDGFILGHVQGHFIVVFKIDFTNSGKRNEPLSHCIVVAASPHHRPRLANYPLALICVPNPPNHIPHPTLVVLA